MSISICGRSGLWPFGFVAVLVCGRFGLWPFRFVAVSVCGRSGLWAFRFVAVSVCGRSGLWPFRFVAVSVLAVPVCGRHDQNPYLLPFAQAQVHWDNKPRQISLNPDLTWHFQFCPVNVSIRHLRYENRARSENRFACYPHYYVTWCPLTTGIVASQFPSSRDAALVTCYLTPFISACLNSLSWFLPR